VRLNSTDAMFRALKVELKCRCDCSLTGAPLSKFNPMLNI
jgi:hypothetical protein